MPNRRVATVAKYDLPKKKRMTKGRWALLVTLVLLIGVGMAWAFGVFDSDPRLAELRALGEKMSDPKLADKDRFALMGEAMKKMQELPPEMQKKLWEERRPRMGGMQNQHIKDTLALPPDKLMAEIDKDIDRMQEMRKQFEQMSKAGGPGNGGPPRGFPGPQGGPNQWKNFHNQMLSSIPADSRAQMTIYRELMQSRAAQRGITMPGPPGR
ncbi:MAG TPA: hypothetical protein VGY55_05195 [Pirellulales bacterium]|nr:hypothetical protein [Pirellulales bacterium]